MPAHLGAHTTGIAIAGAGAVAQSLGKALHDCGIPIACIASRNQGHAEAAATFIGGAAVPCRYRDVPSYASHVIVAVSDRAVTQVAEEMGQPGGGLRVVLHTCGSHGPELLAPLRSVGVSCGSIHPLQTLREPTKGAIALRGIAFVVCGDPEARHWAEEIATVLSGAVIRIDAHARPLYHAAAVMASNYVVALLDSAEHLMFAAGVPRVEARRALAPLVRASVENAFDAGPVEALTGPVVRGDSATVARHVKAMQDIGGSVVDLYKSAGLHTLQMARQRGLQEEDAGKVRQALLGRE